MMEGTEEAGTLAAGGSPMNRLRRGLVAFLSVQLIAALVVPSFAAGGARQASVSSAVMAAGDIVVTAMAFPDASHGWVVGAEGYVAATEDGGATWYRQFVPTAVNLTAVEFIDASHGWAVGEKGTVIGTSDGGITWSLLRSRPAGSEFLGDVDFADANNGWITGVQHEQLPSGILWHTIDGGRTWSRQNPFASDPYPTRPYAGVTCVSPYMAWVCTPSMVGGDGYGDLHVFRTVSAGATWAEVSSGPPLGGGSDDMWTFWDILFVNATNGWLLGNLPGLMRTQTGGDSWMRYEGFWGATDIDMFDLNRGVASGPLDGPGLQTTENGGLSWTPRAAESAAPTGATFVDSSRSSATDVFGLMTTPDTASPEFVVHSPDSGDTWSGRPLDGGIVDFIGGPTRYETAVEISRATFASAETVIVATGRDYPDALAAAGLAGYYDAPVLLVGDTVPPAVAAEITRLGADNVVIVGGTGAVPAAVESALAQDYSVLRLAGVDRYDTARVVAEHLYGLGADTSEAWVVSGENFADALSAASYAAGQDMPVLLVRTTDVPAATAAALEAVNASGALVVGGTGAVGLGVVETLGGLLGGDNVERVAGGIDRYETSAQLAEYASGRGWVAWGSLGIATGALFPDGLAGAAAMGHSGGALLLVRPSSLPPSTAAVIGLHVGAIDAVSIFGDRAGAVSDPVANAVGRILAR